jgi:hypothetical protein
MMITTVRNIVSADLATGLTYRVSAQSAGGSSVIISAVRQKLTAGAGPADKSPATGICWAWGDESKMGISRHDPQQPRGDHKHVPGVSSCVSVQGSSCELTQRPSSAFSNEIRPSSATQRTMSSAQTKPGSRYTASITTAAIFPGFFSRLFTRLPLIVLPL